MTTIESLDTIHTYYANPGIMTEPGKYGSLLRELPAEIPALVNTLQGLALHVFWAERYGVHLPEERQAEVQIRPVREKLARLFELDSRPLTEARPPELRLACNCRDFSLLMVTILKAQGIPARARCGFGTYFIPDHYEDHWITEYWNAEKGRWVQMDAQLDALMRDALNISFDPLDMPSGQFVLAGEAWQMCCQGAANPEDFGIFEWKGWDFIKGNLLRDLLAMNKLEVLPWDFWGLVQLAVADFTAEQKDLLDRAAKMTTTGDAAFDDVRNLYENNLALHIPEEWIPKEIDNA